MDINVADPLDESYGPAPDSCHEELREVVTSGSFTEYLEEAYLDHLDVSEFDVGGFFVESGSDQDEDVDFIVNVYVTNVTIGTIPSNSSESTVGDYTVQFAVRAQ